uniref:Calmodulin-lysine N-methyltransferase n=1 Tax=Noctiluca scintillans TaxID=2966 RepID=A0A7S1ACH8_NOCSC|mmetsp:Transcript_39836/g.105610  ORF Transcript_39836/g.105610 Transcript_39836/m.105610 type:complete len:325 (+) Transcript_39836:29-1003(+)
MAPCPPVPSRAVQHKLSVTYSEARAFIRSCRARPERMRLLYFTEARDQEGLQTVVTVEVANGGPWVEVHEIDHAAGWTGCRLSSSAMWLSLTLAKSAAAKKEHNGQRRALELGCGVGLAGLTLHALGFHTTLTECLEGHMQNLTACVEGVEGLRVRRLDWLEEAEWCGDGAECDVDGGSPENMSLKSLESSRWSCLPREELRSFDLVVASDVLYEPHHAMLLPLMYERWLKPGGRWMICLAVRDAPMLVGFLRRLHKEGIMAPAATPPFLEVVWDTVCAQSTCSFCCRHQRQGPVLLSFLEELVESHEGGCVLFGGVRPCVEGS